MSSIFFPNRRAILNASGKLGSSFPVSIAFDTKHIYKMI